MATNRARRPHYENDRVGKTERVDERDVLFARADLFRKFPDGSPERDHYYSAHPEAREYDKRIADELDMGDGGGVYKPLCSGVFSLSRVIARDEHVDGEPAQEKVELAPEEAARRVKALARTLGADLVGTGPLNPEWVYSHVGRSATGTPTASRAGATPSTCPITRTPCRWPSAWTPTSTGPRRNSQPL